MDATNTEKNTQALSELRVRAMKVTEALYRTTDLFSDAEPLKWSLRDSAVKILNIISDISHQPTYQELRSAQGLEKIIESLCCKLDLATGGTFVARSNFDILEREYKLLSEKISHGNFFDMPLLENDAKSAYKALFGSGITDTLDKRTLIVQKNPMDTTMSDSVQAAPIAEKKQNNYGSLPDRQAGSTPIVAMEVGLPTSAPQVKSPIPVLSDRKGTILKLIKERGLSSVGEMRRLIDTSLSEKTIQRDLNALAEAGILKKEGEKRWRKYFL